MQLYYVQTAATCIKCKNPKWVKACFSLILGWNSLLIRRLTQDTSGYELSTFQTTKISDDNSGVTLSFAP